MPKRSTPTGAAAPAPRGAAPLDALYDAVYAAPDDDAPRSALAEALTAQGDPRGELLTMQLAPAARRDPQREAKLVAKHQKLWLGELANAVRYKTPVRCGPDGGYTGMHIGVRWDRGFLAGVNLEASDARLRKLAAQPAWSTVDFVLFARSETADGAAVRAMLGAARGLRGLAGHRKLLEAAADVPAVRERITTLSAWAWREDTAGDAMAALCGRFPNLRQLAFVYTQDVRPLVASPLFARLEEVYLGSPLHPITVRRAGDDLHVTVVGYDGPVEPWVEAVLAALPAAQVATLSLTGREVSEAHFALAERFPRAGRGTPAGARSLTREQRASTTRR